SGNFIWAKQLGGAADDIGLALAVDASGNVYTTGSFEGTGDFDPGAGNFSMTSSGTDDIFISKLDSSGNFIWAKQLGGPGNGASLYDRVYDIAVDASENVYTTGYFHNVVDFDPGPGTYELATSDPFDYDIFVSKLDGNGNFVWAKQMGGMYNETGTSIAVDANENVYTTGTFNGRGDFDPGIDSFILAATGFSQTSLGGNDIFVSKLNASGNFVWAKQMGGQHVTGLSLEDYSSSIAVDVKGNVYTTGYFPGTADFDPGPSTYNLTPMGGRDIFISKLNASGNFVWAKQIGGPYAEEGNSIAVDTSGNVYTTGYFIGNVDFDPANGPYYYLNSTDISNPAIFVSKLNTDGNFLWAKAFRGFGGNGYGLSITVDNSGNAYTTGTFFGSVDFDPGLDAYNLDYSVGAIFVSKLSPNAVICPSVGTSFTSSIAGNSYQWQVNTGSGFSNISDNTIYSGTNTITLQIDNTPSSWYGYQYRCVVDGTNGAVYSLKFVNRWTGITSTAWETASNWSCYRVPDNYSDIIIDSGMVILNSYAGCRSITVNTGANLTLLTGSVLNVMH
nr:SBBP repeat-containing protein [Chitinophagaceae bacterium]